MPKTPDRALISRLVDEYDQIAEESLGMGDPEFHEIEDQLFDAIVDSPYRAVIKNGDIYLPDPNGHPGNSSWSIPLNRRMWTIPQSSTSTKCERGGSALVSCEAGWKNPWVRSKIESGAKPRRRCTMTADEINRSFPKIADWVRGAGWIEIGTKEWQGFIVRALGEGGGVIEVET